MKVIRKSPNLNDDPRKDLPSKQEFVDDNDSNDAGLKQHKTNRRTMHGHDEI